MTKRSSPTARWIGASAIIITIVVQLGLATMPLWASAASSLTPATTSGTSSYIRQKLVLSTTVAPASTKRGDHSELTAPPGEDSTTSQPWIVSAFSGCTVSVPPPHSSFLPAERSDAYATTSRAGKPRSCSSARIVVPTAPVAPITPTL